MESIEDDICSKPELPKRDPFKVDSHEYNIKLDYLLSRISDLKFNGYMSKHYKGKDGDYREFNKTLTESINEYNDMIKSVSDLSKSKKIDKKSIVSYDDFTSMLKDLYNKKIDAMFVSSSYVSMFASLDGYENIGNDTKVIYEKNKKVIKKTSESNKTLNEPFTLLIMGVDSTSTSLKKSNSFNGDTLMLITFNPNTMNATILSIPRDTRVPIVCTRSKAKN